LDPTRLDPAARGDGSSGRVSPRSSPRPLGAALRGVRGRSEPKTLLAAVQGIWTRAAGDAVASQADPVAERAGTVTVACRSATWAQELDLLQVELHERVNEELAARPGEPDRGRVEALRFTARAIDPL
ncbi:MAG: DciA family protein, partial [Solirubrobacterales bacterium]